jgi:hypothetical protein
MLASPFSSGDHGLERIVVFPKIMQETAASSQFVKRMIGWSRKFRKLISKSADSGQMLRERLPSCIRMLWWQARRIGVCPKCHQAGIVDLLEK